MSERYTRLFSLSKDLQIPGSPVMILAGILARDNQTGKVLVQLKFRNTSNQPIETVKIKINAYDSANRVLPGVASYTYSNLHIEPNGEFGPEELISLPHTATQSFTVEILHVGSVQAASSAPPISGTMVQNREDIKGAQDLKVAKRSKTFANIIVITSLISMFLVFVCFIHDLNIEEYIIALRYGRNPYLGENYYWADFFDGLHRAFYGMIIPFIAIVAALLGRKKPVILKIAFIVCILFLGLQLILVLWTFIVMRGKPSENIWRIRGAIMESIYGIDLHENVDIVRHYFKNLTRIRAKLLFRSVWNLIVCCFGILSNILPTLSLLIFGFRIKKS